MEISKDIDDAKYFLEEAEKENDPQKKFSI